jgi:hypothetical protein
MKLTEDDIYLVSDGEGEYYVKFMSLEGYDIVWTKEQAQQLRQQILDNQKIVEHIRDCHNCGCVGWSNCKVYRQELDNHD